MLDGKPAIHMELDTQGKMISVFRVGLKHKQNKTHRVSHWMDRKKTKTRC